MTPHQTSNDRYVAITPAGSAAPNAAPLNPEISTLWANSRAKNTAGESRTFYTPNGVVVAVSTGEQATTKDENALKELSRKNVRSPAGSSSRRQLIAWSTGSNRYARSQGLQLDPLLDRSPPFSPLCCRRFLPRFVRVEPQDDERRQGQAGSGQD